MHLNIHTTEDNKLLKLQNIINVNKINILLTLQMQQQTSES